MFYHCIDIKYVKYGIIKPVSEKDCDDILIGAYKWLKNYCGYFPQIWLSKNDIDMTGFYNKEYTRYKYQVLFCFENISGFYLDYDLWCLIFGGLINNQSISEYFKDMKQLFINDNEDPLNDEYMNKWLTSKSESEFLKKYLFVENDQLVVPSLNLTKAIKIFCRNKKVRNKLIKMGFSKTLVKIKKGEIK